MKTFEMKFTGRALGSIGKMNFYHLTIDAIDTKHAINILYTMYQDILNLKIKEINLRGI